MIKHFVKFLNESLEASYSFHFRSFQDILRNQFKQYSNSGRLKWSEYTDHLTTTTTAHNF